MNIKKVHLFYFLKTNSENELPGMYLNQSQFQFIDIKEKYILKYPKIMQYQIFPQYPALMLMYECKNKNINETLRTCR